MGQSYGGIIDRTLLELRFEGEGLKVLHKNDGKNGGDGGNHACSLILVMEDSIKGE